MRFDRLFADLEAQLEAAADAELASEVVHRTRGERAKVVLVDRLRASIGSAIRLRLLGAGPIEGFVRSVGPDWVVLREPSGVDDLVPTACILEATSLMPGARAESGVVAGRLDLRYVLGRLARERTPLRLVLRDGSAIVGTIASVGGDVLDLVEARLDEPLEWAASSNSAREGPPVHVISLGGLALVREC